MKTLTVALGDRSYPIHFGEGILGGVTGLLARADLGGTMAIVTDVNVGPLYAGCALNLTVMSYSGSVGIGALACPDSVPELETIPRAFEASLAQLLRHARAVSG